MMSNCFYNNSIGLAPVGIYGGERMFSENFLKDSAGALCPFIADFETAEQMETGNPNCLLSDLLGLNAICPLDGIRQPSTSLTYVPTSPPMPQFSETLGVPPSLMPTVTQYLKTDNLPLSFITTYSPTGTPSLYPAQSPSASPTSVSAMVHTISAARPTESFPEIDVTSTPTTVHAGNIAGMIESNEDPTMVLLPSNAPAPISASSTQTRDILIFIISLVTLFFQS